MTIRVHLRLALDNQRDITPPGPPRFHHAVGYGLVGTRQRVALGRAYNTGPAPRTGLSVLATRRAP
jgi:hypothetical protein